MPSRRRKKAILNPTMPERHPVDEILADYHTGLTKEQRVGKRFG